MPVVPATTPIAKAQPTVAAPQPTVAAPQPSIAIAARDGGTCVVKLMAYVESGVFSGVPETPARRATLDHLDQKTRDEWNGRDHALLYLRCTYDVTMNGRAYRYTYTKGVRSADNPSDSACATAPVHAEAIAQIRHATRNCADAHAGAYDGEDLVERP